MADVNIAEAGDVVLVVGPEAKRIRVSSIFLSVVSPIFDNMLNGNGGGMVIYRGPGLPREIVMVQDKPEAAELFCYVVHHIGPRVPRKILTHELYDFSAFVQKYQAHMCVEHVGYFWLQAALADTPACLTASLWTLFGAAHYLNDAENFNKISCRLIAEAPPVGAVAVDVPVNIPRAVVDDINEISPRLAGISNGSLRMIQGLCLDCVQAGAPRQGGSCRVPHEEGHWMAVWGHE
ncbi:hypothetical protein NA57DRAFT_76251 [Rhizodiscina lignyota]|uniref:BTB domain-containing protein n=1 Tax=Rhizodiscina lignyota TaxID=1504668 RepID=A0A9P4IGU1_9PEZI|nr:hypothetical protein NA57DRAFT_76251 [Rhizodiscina lignyota]